MPANVLYYIIIHMVPFSWTGCVTVVVMPPQPPPSSSSGRSLEDCSSGGSPTSKRAVF